MDWGFGQCKKGWMSVNKKRLERGSTGYGVRLDFCGMEEMECGLAWELTSKEQRDAGPWVRACMECPSMCPQTPQHLSTKTST